MIKICQTWHLLWLLRLSQTTDLSIKQSIKQKPVKSSFSGLLLTICVIKTLTFWRSKDAKGTQLYGFAGIAGFSQRP
jgi:hypothetical protein